MEFYIETQNLILRTFTINDVKDYFEITRDIDIQQYTPGAYIDTLAETKFFFHMCYLHSDLKHDFYIAIEEKNSQKLIGAIIVTQAYSDVFDASYFISKDFRRKGYMKEALQTFLNKFPVSGNIYFEIKKSNLASLNLIKKIEGINELYCDVLFQSKRFYFEKK